MKIGVTQIILGGFTLDDTLDLCREAGYDSVELFFKPGSDLHPDLSDGEIEAAAAKCADAGICISSFMLSGQGNLLSADAEEREARRQTVARTLEVGALLGVDAMLLHPGALDPEADYQLAWDNLRNILVSLAPLACEKGVTICVENVWNRFLLSPVEMRRLVDEVGSPWVQSYLDTANMMAYGYPEQWIRELGPRIKRVHFKDFIRGEHRFVPLMDGDTDWAAVMKELRQAGYSSALVHEIDGDREVQIEMARRMRQIVAM